MLRLLFLREAPHESAEIKRRRSAPTFSSTTRAFSRRYPSFTDLRVPLPNDDAHAAPDRSPIRCHFLRLRLRRRRRWLRRRGRQARASRRRSVLPHLQRPGKVQSHQPCPYQTLPRRRGDVAGGPAFRRRRGGSGVVGERGRDVHEGRDSAIEPARREAGEGSAGLEEEPVSDAVFVLRGKHLRRRAEGTASFA